MASIALVMSIGVLASGPGLDVIEIIKDAQATNAALVASGSAKFRVRYELGAKRPAEARGAFSWAGGDGSWTYQLSDPDAIVTGREAYTAAIEKAPTEYMLLSDGKIYSYNAKTNTLHISRVVDRGSISSAFGLFFDLFPEMLWYRCCPPSHSGGRPWKDMFGPNSPATRPGATVEISSVGEKTYRYTRRDPEGGVLEDDVSLDLAGHVTSHTYTPASGRGGSERITYTWAKAPGGAVVLRDCEVTKGDPGGSRPAERMRIEMEVLRVAKNASRSKLRFAEFEKLLPRNTRVADNITHRSYPLHPDTGPPPDRLKQLSEELRKGGLLKKGGQP